jgi:hypothetical protein
MSLRLSKTVVHGGAQVMRCLQNDTNKHIQGAFNLEYSRNFTLVFFSSLHFPPSHSRDSYSDCRRDDWWAPSGGLCRCGHLGEAADEQSAAAGGSLQ